MIQRALDDLTALYEADETAWLESMADRIRQGRLSDLDYPHLQEYLEDMARRDRREVESRLTVLIVHVLKWIYQPEQRSGSWRATVLAQQHRLAREVGGGVLRRHAEAMLAEIYAEAAQEAAAETGLPNATFPAACPYTLEQLLAADLVAE
jgi:Domain of unknown function DUF29